MLPPTGARREVFRRRMSPARYVGHETTADLTKRLPPWGFARRLSRRQLSKLVSVTSRRFGSRYGNRTRDSQIVSLVLYPSELTDVEVARSDPMYGTRTAQPCRGAPVPLDEQHQRTSRRTREFREGSSTVWRRRAIGALPPPRREITRENQRSETCGSAADRLPGRGDCCRAQRLR